MGIDMKLILPFLFLFLWWWGAGSLLKEPEMKFKALATTFIVAGGLDLAYIIMSIHP